MLSFYRQVYSLVNEIPKGRVSTYGAIGKALGVTNSARMVGRAISMSSQYSINIPAHRVVNRVGILTGKHHFSSPTKMEELLKKEGVMVKHDKIVNFKEHFWNPLTELSID